MKRIMVCVFLMVGLSLTAEATTRGDVKVLEASDTIKYRMNDLTKNYFLLTKFPHKRELKLKMDDDFSMLNKSFQEIAVTTRDQRTKALLTFFAYKKTRLGEILKRPPSEKRSREVLDICEGFLEGASVIAQQHKYTFSLEEKMYKATLSMREHLEAIAKYYVARNLVKDNQEVVKKMKSEIKAFTEELPEVAHYSYTDAKIARQKKSLLLTWKTLEPYVHQADKNATLPMVVDAGVTHMNALLDMLGIYHSKNQ